MKNLIVVICCLTQHLSWAQIHDPADTVIQHLIKAESYLLPCEVDLQDGTFQSALFYFDSIQLELDYLTKTFAFQNESAFQFRVNELLEASAHLSNKFISEAKSQLASGHDTVVDKLWLNELIVKNVSYLEQIDSLRILNSKAEHDAIPSIQIVNVSSKDELAPIALLDDLSKKGYFALGLGYNLFPNPPDKYYTASNGALTSTESNPQANLLFSVLLAYELAPKQSLLINLPLVSMSKDEQLNVGLLSKNFALGVGYGYALDKALLYGSINLSPAKKLSKHDLASLRSEDEPFTIVDLDELPSSNYHLLSFTIGAALSNKR